MHLKTHHQLPGDQNWDINKIQRKPAASDAAQATAESPKDDASPSNLDNQDQFQGQAQAQAAGEPVAQEALFPDIIANDEKPNDTDMELQDLEGSEQSEQADQLQNQETENAEAQVTENNDSNQTESAEQTEDSEQSAQTEQSSSAQFDDSMENLLAMVQEKDYNAQDPQVMLAMQEMIREMEDRNIKAMLEMIQKSLDRAAEMREQQERDYLEKDLPLKMATEAQIQQMHNLAESADQAAVQQAINALDAGVQSLSNAISLQGAATGDQRSSEVFMAAAQALTQALKSQISVP